MSKRESASRFVLCVENKSYPASLELRKIYRSIPDAAAKTRGFVRVIDESGEDYLYPTAYFVSIKVPTEAVGAFAAAGS